MFFCCVFCDSFEKVVRGHTWVRSIRRVMQRTGLTPPQKYNAAREMTSARREGKL